MSRYPVENLLREATEFYSAITFLALALIAWSMPHLLLLTEGMSHIAMTLLAALGFYRFIQGYKIKRYQRRLKAMPYYGLSTRQIPLSKKQLFLGRGFLWTPLHTQRLHQIKQVANQRFIKPGRLYRMARVYARRYPRSWLTTLLNHPSLLNPLKELPAVGGKPYLHGLGNSDKPISIGQDVRVGHTIVLGTTRVGKTRLASILINQDIRNGDALIVVDPKGDLELVQTMYSACVAANRLADFKIVHLGFAEVSAAYNPLKHFDQITEVATRVTDAIAAEGEGKQFADFAWKYVDIVVKALKAMGEFISYEEIGFYMARLDQLLMLYCDKVFATEYPPYKASIEGMIAEQDARLDKQGNPLPKIERSQVVLKFVNQYVNGIIAKGDIKAFQGNLLIELLDAASLDKQYYHKITASVGPVLAKINSSSASRIFSSTNPVSEVELMEVITSKKILYLGLDSLSNATVAQDVGKAFLSDLVSTAGKIYKQPNAHYRVNIHCDELSEIIQESFVKILNKAGGAGFQVTAYAQTKQDLEVALGSRAMAEMTEGNLNTLIMLRVKNKDTATVLTDMLPKVDVVSHTQVSMVNDTPHGEDSVYFNTSNEDRVQMTSIPMLEPSDLSELPKGQAFVLVNGGELYKIRIPLPINDGLAPANVQEAMRELNGFNALKTKSEDANLIQDSKSDEKLASLPLPIHGKPELREPVLAASVMSSDNQLTEFESIISPQREVADNVQLMADFISWLEKRMDSGHKQFSLASQELVLSAASGSNPTGFYVRPEVLAKYQSRSGIDVAVLEGALRRSFATDKAYFIEQNGQRLEVLPVVLTRSFSSEYSTTILEEPIQ